MGQYESLGSLSVVEDSASLLFPYSPTATLWMEYRGDRIWIPNNLSHFSSSPVRYAYRITSRDIRASQGQIERFAKAQMEVVSFISAPGHVVRHFRRLRRELKIHRIPPKKQPATATLLPTEKDPVAVVLYKTQDIGRTCAWSMCQ